LKTRAYLTLEVLYASRRFTSNLDHVEAMLRQMLENQEVLSGFRGATVMTFSESEEMRVIAYIQSTSQVILNFATSQGVNGNDVLKYVSACFSVFCEYLLNTTARIRNAAFTALRMITSQALKKEYFQAGSIQSQAKSTDALLLDAMSLGEEVINLKRGAPTQMSNADKLIIHLRYLLTSRFEESQELALKLMKTFI
jgi:hypothetical protein